MAIIAAGIGLSALGSIGSAVGASQNARAMARAAKKAANRENQLFDRQTDKLDTLIDGKEERLFDLGNIFDRFESTGAFGDTNTLRDLRQAQSDFSALAAGDFTGFESQLRKSMSDTLIATVGSGSPVGTFAGLAADQQMALRKEGVQTAVGLTEFLSNESFKLLGSEFGIMDQEFQSQYEMDRTRTSNINNFSMGAAAQEGVAMSGFGNALTQFGGSVANFGMYRGNLAAQNDAFASSRNSLGQMQSGAPQLASSRPNFNSTVPSRISRSSSIPDFSMPELDASLENFGSYFNPVDQFSAPVRPSTFFVSPDSSYAARLNSRLGGVLPPREF